MKALACLALALACSVQQVPYVAEIDIPQPDSVTYIGAMRCDRNGHPYLEISPRLSDSATLWVRRHEQVHTLQARAVGSCRAMVQRFQVDTMFRLDIESEAYCSVYVWQRRARVTPDPDFDGIVWRLMFRYNAAYTRDAVLKALPCG